MKFSVLLLALTFLLLCKNNDNALVVFTVYGRIVAIDSCNYGIEGKTKRFGSIFAFSKAVRYKIKWLPDSLKSYVNKNPENEFHYIYRVVEDNNGGDWATTIEIFTD